MRALRTEVVGVGEQILHAAELLGDETQLGAGAAAWKKRQVSATIAGNAP